VPDCVSRGISLQKAATVKTGGLKKEADQKALLAVIEGRGRNGEVNASRDPCPARGFNTTRPKEGRK